MKRDIGLIACFLYICFLLTGTALAQSGQNAESVFSPVPKSSDNVTRQNKRSRATYQQRYDNALFKCYGRPTEFLNMSSFIPTQDRMNNLITCMRDEGFRLNKGEDFSSYSQYFATREEMDVLLNKDQTRANTRTNTNKNLNVSVTKKDRQQQGDEPAEDDTW